MRKQPFALTHWSTVTAACWALGFGACAPADPDLGSDLTQPSTGSTGSAPFGPAAPASATSASASGTAAASPAPVASSASGSNVAPSTTSSVPSAGTSPSAAAGSAAPASGGATAGSASSWCQAKAIFDKSCTACHDGKGSSGTPMGLTKYADFQAAAPVSSGKKVFEAVGARMHDTARPMPPKGALSAADLQIVDGWIKAGAPGGEATACASGPGVKEPVASPWPPPEGCDAIYKITSHGAGGVGTPFVVQPNGETHPQVQVDAPWGNEKVQAIAFRPLTDNKLVLHHWILYSNQGGSAVGGGAFLTGWAPGDDERPPMPKDVGVEMPTGANALRLDMHYNSLTATKAEDDQSGVEVCVVKGANLRKNPAAVTMSLAVFGFPLAPANNPKYEATSVCNVTTTQPVHIMTAAPHAHRLAVHNRFVVTKKDGRKIVMLDHPFIYGEQGSYGLDPEVIVETGDKIETTCVYNNPTAQNVNFGPNTADEMCFNFAMYYPSGAFNCGSSLFGL